MKKYSVEDLNYELMKKYGKNGKQIQESQDNEEEFYIWDVYAFLKEYCEMTGKNYKWLDQKDFDYRMKNIQEVLHV